MHDEQQKGVRNRLKFCGRKCKPRWKTIATAPDVTAAPRSITCLNAIICHSHPFIMSFSSAAGLRLWQTSLLSLPTDSQFTSSSSSWFLSHGEIFFPNSVMPGRGRHWECLAEYSTWDGLLPRQHDYSNILSFLCMSWRLKGTILCNLCFHPWWIKDELDMGGGGKNRQF